MSKRARHTPDLSGTKVIRALSVDSALSSHLSDAITQLLHDWHWEEVGDPVSDILLSCKDSIESWYSDMLIGTVFPWIITPPAGWLLLDGSTYASADYPELSALLPAHLIAGSNFTLPDVDNAFPFGVSDEDDASDVVGSNDLTLTIGQLPSHTHTYLPPSLIVQGETPTVPIPAVGIGTAVATGATGSGDNVDKRPLRFGLIFSVYAGRE